MAKKTPAKPPAKMGRPQIEIDMAQLAGLLRLKPTLEDCAAFFKCSPDTIERRVKEATKSSEAPDGLTFAEFREQNLVHTRFSMIRDAIKRAEKSDTMMIFCLKNFCGWADKTEVEHSVSDSLAEKMAKARARIGKE